MKSPRSPGNTFKLDSLGPGVLSSNTSWALVEKGVNKGPAGTVANLSLFPLKEVTVPQLWPVAMERCRARVIKPLKLSRKAGILDFYQREPKFQSRELLQIKKKQTLRELKKASLDEAMDLQLALSARLKGACMQRSGKIRFAY